ncbi:LacI family DNA-binding transcriptional regulator [Rhodococcus fascians]|uniref:LacI family DNA-binding transcriptional regulator n=1 Tax=unclassified Rhodococcus (in: high G+C Gram-positive bacteria) TaxID=192944 RepID=UPI000B9C729B|nr:MULTISPECIES: LacI family DNA-binding transcriptional regulator [unclassified Rhodococcus (in: high G+C Gram-positive bacteria)]MBY4011907.1 LacI family DNA-binding transcriptional regulator [Rhodococcus fascians]MBY4021004.1 LacI family DNA-binding transcriptional regulator [Rhodococcus fascians]OZE36975.1 LacI family transcriptional regulator [Rhodococcus sp. 05-2254-5]OZE54725.1 LacI family transcriptional regulator [Rhodococcus sp. 05-2254-1]
MRPTRTGLSAERTDVVTLRDVAKAAGVSVSTVSRVLDDRVAPSRTATAVRVREIAEQLGYRRNTFASNLRRGATATIGVLVPRLSDTVMALMFEAIDRAAGKDGYHAIVATSGDDPTDEWNAAQSLLERNVDGVVLATSRTDDPLPSHLRDNGIPHVLVLRTDGKSPSSIGDDETGGYLAVRHLIDLGHTDIAVLTGPLFTSSAVGRLAGARRALDEAGVSPRSDWTVETGYGIEAGARAGHELFDATERPTAVFAANDNLALGVLSAAHRHNLAVGVDLSLVGYNDIPLAQLLPVPLTSVRTAFDQIAGTAMDLLINGTDDSAAVHKALPTLIPRQSSSRAIR